MKGNDTMYEDLKKVRNTVTVKTRSISTGCFFTNTTKNGYRWFVGGRFETGFTLRVEKRYQFTKTSKSFKTVARYTVDALQVPGLLSCNPEDHIN